MKRVAFRVRGRVQGVGFRWFTTTAAERLDVHGWVRNRRDGDVEGEAQGTSDAIQQFLAQLRQGPRWSHVTAVETDEREVREREEARFTVRH